MRVGIMQPYFLPYIGYFQLMISTNVFILHDDLKYTKGGWINRNRIISKNNTDKQFKYFTLPLEKASDYEIIKNRRISSTYSPSKMLSIFKDSYSQSTEWKQGIKILEEILSFESRNLFDFICNSILIINKFLEIEATVVTASSLNIDHDLKGVEKIYAICKLYEATHYVNLIGGINLYNHEDFKNKNTKLYFLKPTIFQYNQNLTKFVDSLSIIDLIMFIERGKLIQLLRYNYKLI